MNRICSQFVFKPLSKRHTQIRGIRPLDLHPHLTSAFRTIYNYGEQTVELMPPGVYHLLLNSMLENSYSFCIKRSIITLVLYNKSHALH